MGVPLAPHKITAPATDTIFLGIKIDTLKQEIQLPKEKITQYSNDIKEALPKSGITLKNLQEIVGKLSFATAAVPGRVYLGRLFRIFKGAANKKIIKLDKNAKKDLNMWLAFMENYNGTTFFRNLQILHGTTINLQADASKKGYGATFGNQWVQGEFPADWKALNIAILEFYPLFLLFHMFAQHFKNSIVIFYTDNEAVSLIIKDCMTKDDIMLHFLREITLICADLNIDLRAQHVSRVKNVLCDKISRLQVSQELLRAHGMREKPESVPAGLRPTTLLLRQIST